MNSQQTAIFDQLTAMAKSVAQKFNYRIEVVKGAKDKPYAGQSIGMRIYGFVPHHEVSQLNNLAAKFSDKWSAYESTNERTQAKSCFIGYGSQPARPSIDDAKADEFVV